MDERWRGARRTRWPRSWNRYGNTTTGISPRTWCRRSVPSADYTTAGVGVVVLGEVTCERSQVKQVSKHPSNVEERLRPNDSEPIDEPPLRDRLHIFTLGVTRVIKA